MLAAQGLAGTPGKINYQGPIVDTDTGDTPEGTNTMIFRVFDQADGGAKLWSESQVAEVGSMGIFSVILASTNSIDLSFSAPDWIEVGVAGEVLSPRRETVNEPCAFRNMRSDDADMPGGLDNDTFCGFWAQA